MASAQPEVIYKGWLKKSTEPESNAKKKNFLNRSSSSWKKRYVVLLKETEDNQDVAVLAVFDKDVACNFNKPRASLRLSPWYRVDKKYDPTGKQHIFEVRTSRSTWRFLADSQTVMDLWVFYLQIQANLRTDFPGRCFEVSPDDSESMRRIGARASQCLLHLSKWGLTLALKRTRSLVAQWPLKCIREFESSETGRFSFKAGRNSPMGAADYVFATVLGQDGEIYDLLDAYTTEDLSSQPENQSGPASAEVVNQDYERLRLATFGLLPRRGSEGRPISPNHTQHSQAVPVPGRPKNYDRLDRSRDGSNKRLDRTKSDKVKRTQAAPPVPSRTPSLPPKTSRPPSASSSLAMEPEYNLPYADMGGRTVEDENLPYTEMGSASVNTLTRQGLGRDSKDRMTWDVPIPRTLTNSTAASDRSSYQLMDFTPQSYRNTLTQSYENTPLISPSPRARGMSNGGFVNSPMQRAMTEMTIQDHEYHMVESTRGAAGGSGSDPPSPLVHTYFEGEFTGSKGSSGEREHHYQGVDYEGVGPEGSLSRSFSLGNLRSPTSITDSYIDRSPNLGSLDLAFSFSPANMPNWMNERQLPSLPRDEVPPTEENPYVVSPKKGRYAYEDVNNIFPPTPAQGAQQTEYESVSNTSAEEINVQNHVMRQSTFSEGYVDSNLVRSQTDSFQPNTARIVTQESANLAHSAIVEPGVMYAQVVASVPAPEAEPKEKRKSFKARTLERVKMKKAKSLVDLSVTPKSPERRSVALEDMDNTKVTNSLGRPKKMKKSKSNPNLLSEQPSSTPEVAQHFISPKKGADIKQSPVTGVRRKFGLGLKMMRQKSRSQDEEGGGESPGKPKVLPSFAKIDVKGISTTDKTKSYSRRSQGQLSDLPLDGAVDAKIKQAKEKGGAAGKRQRTVSAGSAMSVQSMLNEQSNSTGMITNPLALGSQSPGESSEGPELDEQGYLSPSEIGSPVKMIADPLSDRPLPERPLPSPPSHSQSAPLSKVRDAKITQVWEL
ncbi:uncharacterized protein LOC100889758 [Strongylocentrotus purpuratus]|uniref:PH domain-containing protein n=1 Tax=Strongylocentrotus purpuratus TaxID=7668 RepID=A0A7M7PPA5_STRPU|nr:uncharacterized protein LOC100889758 [Strongylocentrotus purpuratus]